jgi:hypothetical protein
MPRRGYVRLALRCRVQADVWRPLAGGVQVSDEQGYPAGAGPIDLCKCGKKPALNPHPCPYQSDVNDDEVFECTCCEDCAQECCDDI